MNNFRITYLCVDDYGGCSYEEYEIESACNSVGLFVVFHKWALDILEKNHIITAIEKI